MTQRPQKWRRQGFTLVELIVVLVVLGITASVAVPTLTSYYDQANTTRAITEAHAAVSAANTLCSEKYAAGSPQDQSGVLRTWYFGGAGGTVGSPPAQAAEYTVVPAMAHYGAATPAAMAEVTTLGGAAPGGQVLDFICGSDATVTWLVYKNYGITVVYDAGGAGLSHMDAATPAPTGNPNVSTPRPTASPSPSPSPSPSLTPELTPGPTPSLTPGPSPNSTPSPSPLTILFEKLDSATSGALSGAKLRVTGPSGFKAQQWTSGKNPKQITFTSPGTYTFEEIIPPAYYNIAPDITFTVVRNGDELALAGGGNKITMLDRMPTRNYTVVVMDEYYNIWPNDFESIGVMISGDVLLTPQQRLWNTGTSNPHTVPLPVRPGSYTLESDEGALLQRAEIKFTVDAQGLLSKDESKSTSAESYVDNATSTIYLVCKRKENLPDPIVNQKLDFHYNAQNQTKPFANNEVAFIANTEPEAYWQAPDVNRVKAPESAADIFKYVLLREKGTATNYVYGKDYTITGDGGYRGDRAGVYQVQLRMRADRSEITLTVRVYKYRSVQFPIDGGGTATLLAGLPWEFYNIRANDCDAFNARNGMLVLNDGNAYLTYSDFQMNGMTFESFIRNSGTVTVLKDQEVVTQSSKYMGANKGWTMDIARGRLGYWNNTFYFVFKQMNKGSTSSNDENYRWPFPVGNYRIDK